MEEKKVVIVDTRHGSPDMPNPIDSPFESGELDAVYGDRSPVKRPKTEHRISGPFGVLIVSTDLTSKNTALGFEIGREDGVRQRYAIR